ncbi:hypothetical protein J6590_076434 [Homalodisca vitripennis]|nr:hypothetical protein J6590_076434 [Homalodisca vitripennis]
MGYRLEARPKPELWIYEKIKKSSLAKVIPRRKVVAKAVDAEPGAEPVLRPSKTSCSRLSINSMQTLIYSCPMTISLIYRRGRTGILFRSGGSPLCRNLIHNLICLALYSVRIMIDIAPCPLSTASETSLPTGRMQNLCFDTRVMAPACPNLPVRKANEALFSRSCSYATLFLFLSTGIVSSVSCF